MAGAAAGEEERLLREILALQHEMAQELKAIREELARSGHDAAPAPRAPSGQREGLDPLIEALAGHNKSAMRAAESLTTPNRRKS